MKINYSIKITSDVHVECIPDEVLVKELGIPKKDITHHDGKSRVFNYIANKTNQIALVDEDPGLGHSKHSYEKELVFQEEKNGVKRFYDTKRNNTVFVLKEKLEDWIIECCKKSKIAITQYGSLPSKPNELHRVINDKLKHFEKLVDALLKEEDNGVVTLKGWLKEARTK